MQADEIKQVEETMRGLLNEFQAATEIVIERHAAQDRDDYAAMEGLENIRRRILKYAVGLATPAPPFEGPKIVAD